MRHGTAALVALFAILFAHPLQHDPPVPQRRVIGLVEIPRLLSPEEPGARPREVAINLYQDAASNSPIAVTVRDRERLETREHGYEEVSAVAYDRRVGWYLLCSKDRYAWLSPADAGQFRRYPDLLKDKLTYLTREWDRALHESPGGPVRAKVPPASTERPDARAEEWGEYGPRPSDVTVIAQRQHAGEWWVRVRIAASVCESGSEDAKPIAEGWVRAYSPSGLPTLWFFSRGC